MLERPLGVFGREPHVFEATLITPDEGLSYVRTRRHSNPGWETSWNPPLSVEGILMLAQWLSEHPDQVK